MQALTRLKKFDKETQEGPAPIILGRVLLVHNIETGQYMDRILSYSVYRCPHLGQK